MSSFAARRHAILELLADRPVRSQAELRSLLSRRGHPASQPVLSRDLRALQVAKRDGRYQALEELRVTPLEKLRPLLRGAATASHFVVVRCEPGAGSAVARALDLAEVDGLVGTVAGDDTVIVALASATAARGVRRQVSRLVAAS